MNSPSTNLAWHYAGAADGHPHDTRFQLPGMSGFDPAAQLSHHLAAPPQHSQDGHRVSGNHRSAAQQFTNGSVPAYALTGSAVSDASLLLGLNSPYNNQNNTHSFPSLPVGAATDMQHNYAAPAQADMRSYSAMQPFGDMMIESHDVDMSMLGLDMMPWFETPYGAGQDMIGMFDPTANEQVGNGAQHNQQPAANGYDRG